jgi:hypothetical protein
MQGMSLDLLCFLNLQKCGLEGELLCCDGFPAAFPAVCAGVQLGGLMSLFVSDVDSGSW